jgi:hypothetical protein
MCLKYYAYVCLVQLIILILSYLWQAGRMHCDVGARGPIEHHLGILARASSPGFLINDDHAIGLRR